MAAGTAILGIAHDVDAATSAGIGARGAFFNAIAASAEQTGPADIAAGPAIVRVCLNVDTSAQAIGQARVATGLAGAAITYLTISALVAQLPTVVGITGNVDYDTSDAIGPGIAGMSTAAAVIQIVHQIAAVSKTARKTSLTTVFAIAAMTRV